MPSAVKHPLKKMAKLTPTQFATVAATMDWSAEFIASVAVLHSELHAAHLNNETYCLDDLLQQ
ncbi:unnamed protein product [marine sediment metagenome]|uniref:Uncharacterized protein n=1 Tax=marine sediment metagenome TaxID=412755 RepID=X0YMM3_9ZZZZ